MFEQEHQCWSITYRKDTTNSFLQTRPWLPVQLQFLNQLETARSSTNVIKSDKIRPHCNFITMASLYELNIFSWYSQKWIRQNYLGQSVSRSRKTILIFYPVIMLAQKVHFKHLPEIVVSVTSKNWPELPLANNSYNSKMNKPKSCRSEVECSLVSQYQRNTEHTVRLNCCDSGKLIFFLAQQIHWDREMIVNLC